MVKIAGGRLIKGYILDNFSCSLELNSSIDHTRIDIGDMHTKLILVYVKILAA